MDNFLLFFLLEISYISSNELNLNYFNWNWCIYYENGNINLNINLKKRKIILYNRKHPMQYQRKHVAMAAASGFEPRFLS